MDHQDRSAMRGAISEVLETMFFVFADFSDVPPEGFECECESAISFHNDAERLDITFKTTEEFARVISANLLGVDEGDVSSDDLEDTMKEFANMVGGNFKARIDENNHWELGIPRFRPSKQSMEALDAGLAFSCVGRPMGTVIWNNVQASEKPEW